MTTTVETAEVSQPTQAEPRYAPGTDELSTQVLAAREKVGRVALAEFLGVSQSAVWRAERSRIHPTEVAHLRERMADIDQLPVPEPKARGLRADLTAVIDAAAADKTVTKAKLIEQLRDVLAPKA
jgi:transcriptional regulator with XRE-family HTH domain